MLGISLGAIIALILGAGIISSFFGRPAEPTAPTALLPDSPYSITWENVYGNLISNEGINREVRTKFSLLNVQFVSTLIEETPTSNHKLIFTISAFIFDQSSSTSEICAWKLPANIRRVSDELGILVLPMESYFESTQDAEHCIKPGLPTVVEKDLVFPIPEAENEFLFTAKDSSNILFTVHLSEDGTIVVERAPQEIPG